MTITATLWGRLPLPLLFGGQGPGGDIALHSKGKAKRHLRGRSQKATADCLTASHRVCGTLWSPMSIFLAVIGTSFCGLAARGRSASECGGLPVAWRGCKALLDSLSSSCGLTTANLGPMGKAAIGRPRQRFA